MSKALAQIEPVKRAVRVAETAVTSAVQSAAAAPQPKVLSGREKAAIIVRLLLSEGTPLPLSALPDHLQAALTEQIGQMRRVDRVTLRAVVEEFLGQIEGIGLSFPGGIDGALSMLDGHISANAASRLRRLSSASAKADPWERLVVLETDRLLPVLQEESTEIGAVMLSKLPVPKAAALLGRLPGEKARRIAYAMSQTAHVDPETVRRIGLSLAGQLDAEPPSAFETGPVERVGAILNVTTAMTRDDVLLGLEEADKSFAEQVRKAIFTFIHIPKRVDARDIPKIIRIVDQPVLVTALAAAIGPLEPVADFILQNMSQRMSAALREEMAERGKVKEKDGEEAMTAVVNAIRTLEASAEIALLQEEAEE